MSISTNNKYKDSVFTAIFGEPERLLELYNALTGSNFSPDTPIEINTLSDVLFMDRINDVSFVINDSIIVLAEHQSTVCENMPLRFLLYIARVYEKLIDNTAVYRRKLIKIPTPRFWVLYNGTEPFPAEKTLRLSDAYKEASGGADYGGLELSVRIININKGFNEDLVSKSETLNGYVTFIAKVRENQQAGLSLEDAVTDAVKYCVERNILQTFLHNHSSEVINMLTTEFDLTTALAVSKEEGVEEGRLEGRLEMIASVLESGISPDLAWQIAKRHGISQAEFERLKKDANIGK